jgi:hypothetical protein
MIDPMELAMLQRVFDELCARRGVEKGTSDAANIAARIIELYQCGFKDGKALRVLMV